MNSVDVRLIDPDPESVAQALRRAMRAANRRLKVRRVERTLRFWRNVARQTVRPREGLRRWTRGRGGWPTARITLAWWTDHVGRRHYRAQGAHYPSPYEHARLPPSPLESAGRRSAQGAGWPPEPAATAWTSWMRKVGAASSRCLRAGARSWPFRRTGAGWPRVVTAVSFSTWRPRRRVLEA